MNIVVESGYACVTEDSNVYIKKKKDKPFKISGDLQEKHLFIAFNSS